ncbi:MAG: VWA domain-containing protein [Chitinispirillaceae bacterium]|nr:VWA domain-containing protein [Chitinispirillaceae bacterium]
MKFGNPEYFLLWLLLPVIIGFFIWAYQRRKAALRRFASLDLIGKLTPSSDLSRRIAKWTLFCCSFFFLVVALMRPRFGVKMEMVQRKGIDLIVALDISQSMLAEDITPSRIERAKYEIAKLIDLLKGDRIGIVVFAGESFVQCPLTLDYGAAKMFLDAVSTGWVERQGTALADAIARSTEAFRSQSRKHKVLVLLTDGEDQEGDALAAAKKAEEEGIIIYTIGVGSEDGVPIPVRRDNDNIVYKKDKSGNLVMTKLNPLILEKIAIEGKGAYFHAGSDLELSRIVGAIASMEKKDLGASAITTYEERYQFPLFAAILLLLIEFFIPERTRRQQVWKGRFE